jgi:hypothetical protein
MAAVVTRRSHPSGSGGLSPELTPLEPTVRVAESRVSTQLGVTLEDDLRLLWRE